MSVSLNTQANNASAAPYSECPYCQSNTLPYFSARDINRHTTDVVFSYHKCNSCGLVFLRDPPQSLVKFYAGGYQPIPTSLEELRALAKKERYRLEPVLNFRKRGKLLELGPWIGIFSSNAKDAGFDVKAIDMNAECVDFLNNTVGIDAIRSDDPVAAMAALNDHFDVIAMWHCLEHFREPWKVIEQAARLLRPGGVLLVAIPNIESFEFSMLGSRWTHIDAPRHLYFLPLGLLNSVASSFDLGSTETTTTSDKLSWQLRQSSWYALVRQLVPIPGVGRAVGAVIGRICSVLIGRNRSGAGITAVFVKRGERTEAVT
jgi:2-polyprenyl-3-methyl-5-hydroxy-6-metoxy-1,4-benzoquinol methylase